MRATQLRSARARDQPELDLRQAEPRALPRDPVVAAERKLEPAAERKPVDRRHDRLVHRLDRPDQVDQRGRHARLAELGYVGTRGEGALTPGQHHRPRATILPGFRERLHHAFPQRMAERVDWRVLQRDQRDVAVPPIIHDLVDAAHRAPPPLLRRNAA